MADAHDPHVEQAGGTDREIASSVGSSFQAKMSKPDTEKALVIA